MQDTLQYSGTAASNLPDNTTLDWRCKHCGYTLPIMDSNGLIRGDENKLNMEHLWGHQTQKLLGETLSDNLVVYPTDIFRLDSFFPCPVPPDHIGCIILDISSRQEYKYNYEHERMGGAVFMYTKVDEDSPIMAVRYGDVKLGKSNFQPLITKQLDKLIDLVKTKWTKHPEYSLTSPFFLTKLHNNM